MGRLNGYVATAELGRREDWYAAGQAVRISNCSARDGFGLKAYLACRLRIMWTISMSDDDGGGDGCRFHS